MALDHFVGFLRREMVIPPQKISRRRPRPTEQCVQAYQRYLREERLLAEATIANYVPLIRLFLRARFGVRPVKLSDLCARDVVQFVQKLPLGEKKGCDGSNRPWITLPHMHSMTG